MDEQFSSEFCCSIGAFYHTWNVLLLVLTLNKAYLKSQTLVFYGAFLQPVSLVSFALTNAIYLASIVARNAALVWAVAYAWCLSLALIFPAALIDRVLFYVDRSFVCQEGDDCDQRGKFLVNAGQSLMFLSPFLVYIALLQLEYAKRVSRAARIKLDSEQIKRKAAESHVELHDRAHQL